MEASFKCKNCTLKYSTRELKRVPLILSCGCTYCKQCLSQLVRDGYIRCTHCKGKTSINPSQSLTQQLPANFYILGRLVAKELNLPSVIVSSSFEENLQPLANGHNAASSTVDLDHSLNLRATRCEECGAVATCSCLQCDGYYCASCFDTTHMSTNSMRRHKALPVTQLSDNGPTHCHTHPTHLLCYYCKDDTTTCCSECCITGGHKGHDVVSITEMAESQRQKITPLITEAKNRVRELKAASEDIDNRLKVHVKDVRRELLRLDKQFGWSYSLLQLHQQQLTESYCSAVINSLSPHRELQAKLKSQIQSTAGHIRWSQEAVDNDFALLKDASTIIDHLSSVDMATDVGKVDDLYTLKVRLNLSNFKQYLVDSLGTIEHLSEEEEGATTLKGDLTLSDISINVSGVASPAHPANTPLSSRPTSAMSECYLSSALVGSERGSKASSVRSISPSPSKKLQSHSHLEDVRRDETIAVTVSHIVSVEEFYVRSHDQSRQVKEMSAILSSFSPPLKQLQPDSIKDGMLCVAVSSRDGMLYRVQLCSLSEDDLPIATVKFIDTGSIGELSITSLYTLPPSLHHQPPLCVQCYLHAVHPPKMRYQNHATPTLWTTNANRIFTELLSDKVFNMKVYRQRSSGVLSVDLLTFDSRGSEDGEVESCSSIIGQLIDRGVAVLNNRKWVEPHFSVSLGVGDCLEVTVPTAENPWDFYVQLASGQGDLAKIGDLLCHHVRRLERSTLPPYKNMLCCSQFPEDGRWYRAKVKGVKGDAVEIVYVDFGNTETVGKEDIFLLPDKAFNFAFQAVHCRLFDVQPIGSQEKWSEEVSDLFNELVGQPDYQMVVKATGMPLSVELVDKTTGKSLSALLVELKMAEYMYAVRRQSPLVLVDKLSPAREVRPLTSESTIPDAELPSVGETLVAKVVHVQSLAYFIVQRSNDHILRQLERLKNVKQGKSSSDVKPGSAGLARFPGDDGYHRVTVLSAAKGRVEVLYVDFGNCLELPSDQVLPLPRELADAPALALPCSLVGGVKDSSSLSLFSELVVDKPLSVTVKGVSSGPPSVLLVSLMDEQGYDIEDQLSEINSTNCSSTPLDDDTVDSDIASSSDQEPKVTKVNGAPEKRKMEVCVTFLSEEGIVYGHDITTGAPTADNLRIIEDVLLEYSTQSSKFLPPDSLSLHVGQKVCAKSLEDGILYRAVVRKTGQGHVTVYYVDYGNTEQLPVDLIIPEAALPDFPPQAIGLQLPEYLHGDIIDTSISVVVSGAPMNGVIYKATVASGP